MTHPTKKETPEQTALAQRKEGIARQWDRILGIVNSISGLPVGTRNDLLGAIHCIRHDEYIRGRLSEPLGTSRVVESREMTDAERVALEGQMRSDAESLHRSLAATGSEICRCLNAGEVVDGERLVPCPDCRPAAAMRAALVGLVGVDTPEELREMAEYIETFADTRDDAPAILGAINVLLAIRSVEDADPSRLASPSQPTSDQLGAK